MSRPRAVRRRGPRPPVLWLVEEFGHGGIGRYAVDVANLVGDAVPTVVATTDAGPVPGLRGRHEVWFPRGGDSPVAKARAAATGLVRAVTRVRRGDSAWVPLGIRPGFELALVLALRLGGARVVATVHNRGPHSARRASPVVRLAAQRSGAVVVHTDALEEWAREAGAAAVRLPFVPPDVRAADDEHGGQRLRCSDLPVPEGHVLVALLGYQYPYKGPDVLLRALARARETDPALPVHVLLAGRASSELDLPALHRELGLEGAATLRLGWLEEAELADLLDAADVVALPYHRIDNSGMGAMARGWGLPALASDLPLLRGMYEGAALFSAPGDVEGLARQLTDLPAALPRLREAAAVRPADDLTTAYRTFAATLLP